MVSGLGKYIGKNSKTANTRVHLCVCLRERGREEGRERGSGSTRKQNELKGSRQRKLLDSSVTKRAGSTRSRVSWRHAMKDTEMKATFEILSKVGAQAHDPKRAQLRRFPL